MSTPSPLRRLDLLLLVGYCAVLFSFPLWFNRSLTIHETVHCVNIREMRLDGDWIIPHYGGRPWLERPPLPFWLTMPFLAVLGDTPSVFRLPPLLVATLCAVLVAWMASVWYGRVVGLLAGAILVTLREFTHYATAPECDMFLCGVVTSALALFVYLEFRRRPASDERGFLWGARPWALLGFFVLLGLANLVKGLFFGDLWILLPVAAFLLCGPDRWTLLRRYFWLPGWVAFLAVGSAWAVSAYVRYPDIVELWRSDYAGRVHEHYMTEPFWYYLPHLLWNLFPWTIAALIGLAVTWSKVRGAGRTPERFLWCWALVPVAFFSLLNGKHHHYLLHGMTPWAILAAVGTVRFWEWLHERNWVPQSLQPTPVAVALFAVLVPLHWSGHALFPVLKDRYREDRAFVEKVRQMLPADAPLLVLGDIGPLDASWMLFYFQNRAGHLHNASFLRELPESIREVYVISRRMLARQLSDHGECSCLLESNRSRDEGTAEHRFGLYRVRLSDRFVRSDRRAYISPMQATGRAPGPVLE